MLDQEKLIEQVAAYKKDSRKRFFDAVSALLALAWPYRGMEFVFDETFPLYADALDICRRLSDQCAADARERLAVAIESLQWDGDAWAEAYGEEEEASLDMAGSHLLELLGVWIVVAFVNGWTQSYTRVMMSRYLNNPFLCPEWRNIPLDALAWGKGYARDVAEQIAVIGQGIIISGARYAEQQSEKGAGAVYYIRHRNSGYDCDDCDALCGYPIPIDVPFVIEHPRCVCYAEYFYEPMP